MYQMFKRLVELPAIVYSFISTKNTSMGWWKRVVKVIKNDTNITLRKSVIVNKG